MTASADVAGMAIVLVTPAGHIGGTNKRVLDTILGEMHDDEGLIVPGYERGYCGGWDVTVTPAGAKTKYSASDMYLVTDRGLYVGILEKTGLLSSQPACRFYPHGAIARCLTTVQAFPDGEGYNLTLKDQRGDELVRLGFVYLASGGFANHAEANAARLKQALGFTE